MGILEWPSWLKLLAYSLQGPLQTMRLAGFSRFRHIVRIEDLYLGVPIRAKIELFLGPTQRHVEGILGCNIRSIVNLMNNSSLVFLSHSLARRWISMQDVSC